MTNLILQIWVVNISLQITVFYWKVTTKKAFWKNVLNPLFFGEIMTMIEDILLLLKIDAYSYLNQGKVCCMIFLGIIS